MERALDSVIWERWMNSSLPDPTTRQIGLYLQLREALWMNIAAIHQDESPFFEQNWLAENIEPFQGLLNTSREGMVHGLHRVATLENLEDMRSAGEDLTCRICFRGFDEPPYEQPVRLSCTHIYGKNCLENWIREAQPGFHICAKCDKKFDGLDMLTRSPYKGFTPAGARRYVVVPLRLEDADEVAQSDLDADYTIVYANLLRRAELKFAHNDPPIPPPPSPWWLKMLRGEGTLILPDVADVVDNSQV
ncbi:uncharacterized protein BP5553_04234 [Venustampulla echinocandica]|uniref:RING-type domain-containing protein n=1 Tax=Venustampulla echinocandica TaxID=2656787 RepID=A0A370TWI6_9HELO|nr:uncharacterized protein BP5553_04234 [Venustampulla echinocandica]RDL39894.1 hypothetical protein BP5553_04234 [Venustampulla echinocandica]